MVRSYLGADRMYHICDSEGEEDNEEVDSGGDSPNTIEKNE